MNENRYQPVVDLLAIFRSMAKQGFLEKYAEELIDELMQLMVDKGKDYSTIFPNEWGSFEVTAHLARQPMQKTFAMLIALKVTRSISLSMQYTLPKFEGQYDTWKDLVNYIILWLAYLKYQEDLANPFVTEVQNEIHSDSAD